MRGPIELLKASFKDIRQHSNLLIGVMVVLGVFSLLVSYLEPFRTSGASNLGKEILYVGVVLVYMVMSVLASVSLMLGFSGRVSGVMEAYRQASSYFWRYVGLSIVLTIVIAVGYLFLIIPGIIFSIWFIFAGFILVLEDAGIKDAMSRSRAYVKGKWWGVLWRTLTMLIVPLIVLPLLSIFTFVAPDNAFLMSLSSTLGGLIVTLIGIGYFYNLYQDVKGGGSVMEETPGTPNYGDAMVN